MNEYIVFENIPNTPEGRLFLKLLRKYLRPQYRMRSRGRHSDRKGLAKELAAKGVYLDLGRGDTVSENRVHDKLRAGMSCKYAERITTVVEARNEHGISWRSGGKQQGKRGFYFSLYDKALAAYVQQGPFKKWDDAVAAQRVTKGTGK